MSQFLIHVIEGKEYSDNDDAEFGTTAWVFHEMPEAKQEAKDLLERRIFVEVRIRTYYPNINDTGLEVFE